MRPTETVNYRSMNLAHLKERNIEPGAVTSMRRHGVLNDQFWLTAYLVAVFMGRAPQAPPNGAEYLFRRPICVQYSNLSCGCKEGYGHVRMVMDHGGCLSRHVAAIMCLPAVASHAIDRSKLVDKSHVRKIANGPESSSFQLHPTHP